MTIGNPLKVKNRTNIPIMLRFAYNSIWKKPMKFEVKIINLSWVTEILKFGCVTSKIRKLAPMGRTQGYVTNIFSQKFSKISKIFYVTFHKFGGPHIDLKCQWVNNVKLPHFCCKSSE